MYENFKRTLKENKEMIEMSSQMVRLNEDLKRESHSSAQEIKSLNKKIAEEQDTHLKLCREMVKRFMTLIKVFFYKGTHQRFIEQVRRKTKRSG